MAVSVGDIIDAATYNDYQSRVATILGTGSGQSGYGQSLSSSQVNVADTVTSANMNALYTDIRKCTRHQSGSNPNLEVPSTGKIIGADDAGVFLRLTQPVEMVIGETLTQATSGASGVITSTGSSVITVVGSATSGYVSLHAVSGTFNNTNQLTGSISGPLGADSVPTIIDVKDRAGFNDYDTEITTITTNKNDIDTAGNATAGNFSGGSASRTTNWRTVVDCSFDITFTDTNQRRYWFNAGGEIRVTATLTGQSGSKSNDWSTLLSNSGTVKMNYTETTTTGSGTTTTIGNYDLTTTYQTLFTKNGSGNYAENEYKIEARVDSTNAAKLQFRITLTDADTGDPPIVPVPFGGTPGGVDEYVNGTLTVTMGYLQPSGSYVSVALPSVSRTNNL